MLRGNARRVLKRLQAPYEVLTRIELSSGALEHNVRLIQQQHPEFEIMPVLKGNAYGHGIEPIAGLLNQIPGRLVAVDGYFEALAIRDLTRRRILVMGYVLPVNVPQLDLKRCSYVVQDVAGLEAFGKLGRPAFIHVELNTGFNRLGLQPDELPVYLETLQKFPDLELEGVMTHLVDADNAADDSCNVRQQKLFDAGVEKILEAGFRPGLVHIAQTAGSPKIVSTYANAIRLGIGTYGINPLTESDPHYRDLADLRPVLELKSTIVKAVELKPGDTVSYNATFTAPQAMRIGVLPLGYYDGVPRALSNAGCATHGEVVLPIVGRVCMNHTMIDLGGTKLGVGDEVTLISSDPRQPNSVAGLAAHHGLFPYTTLTGLAASGRREIVP